LPSSFLSARSDKFTPGLKEVQGVRDDKREIIADMDGGVGKRLDALLEEKNMSGAELGRLVGVSRASVSAWRRGLTADLKARHLNKMASIFGVNPRWLETGFGSRELVNSSLPAPQVRYDVPHTGHTHLHLRNVPVLTWEQATHWGGDVSGSVEYVPVATEVSSRAFAIRQQGDAMVPDVKDGAFVVIDPVAEVSHGSVVLAKRPLDQIATLRMLWYDGGVPSLRAMNSAYPSLDMPADTVVVGKAVWVQAPL
jgi:SOS-response transcriptional repressor LexA